MANVEELKEEFNRGYEKGLDDAWETAQRLINNLKFDREFIEEVFKEGEYSDNILFNFSAEEVMNKFKAYDEEIKKIKVGDEVVSVYDDDVKFVVLQINQLNDKLSGVGKLGNYTNKEQKYWEKTGKHYDIVDTLIKQIKGDN